MINKILQLIDQPLLTPEIKKKHTSILGGTFWHGMASVSSALGTTFASSDCFYVNRKKYSMREFYDVSMNFYARNNRIVECNQNLTIPRYVFDSL